MDNFILMRFMEQEYSSVKRKQWSRGLQSSV